MDSFRQVQEFRALAGRYKGAAPRALGLGKLRISRADSTLKARGASADAGEPPWNHLPAPSCAEVALIFLPYAGQVPARGRSVCHHRAVFAPRIAAVALAFTASEHKMLKSPEDDPSSAFGRIFYLRRHLSCVARHDSGAARPDRGDELLPDGFE